MTSNPYNSTSVNEPSGGASQATSDNSLSSANGNDGKGALESALDGKNNQHQPIADFLYQLTKMLTDDNSEIIEWSDGRIKVHYPERLEAEVLHKYFRHSKFASFQRQLNYFGFRKIAGKGKMSPCSYVNEAATDDIRSLLLIKRKTNGSAARRAMQQRAALATNLINPALMGAMNFGQFANQPGAAPPGFPYDHATLKSAMALLQQQNAVNSGLSQLQPAPAQPQPSSQFNTQQSQNQQNSNFGGTNSQVSQLLAFQQQLQQQQQQQNNNSQQQQSQQVQSQQQQLFQMPQAKAPSPHSSQNQMAPNNQFSAQMQAILQQQRQASDNKMKQQEEEPQPTRSSDATRLAIEQLQAQLQRTQQQFSSAPLSHSTSFGMQNPATAALASQAKDGNKNPATSALNAQGGMPMPATAAMNESSTQLNALNPFESALNIQSLIEAHGGDDNRPQMNPSNMSQLLLQRLPSSAAIFPSSASFENLFNSNARLNSLLSLSGLIPGSREQSSADFANMFQSTNALNLAAAQSNYRANQ